MIWDVASAAGCVAGASGVRRAAAPMPVVTPAALRRASPRRAALDTELRAGHNRRTALRTNRIDICTVVSGLSRAGRP